MTAISQATFSDKCSWNKSLNVHENDWNLFPRVRSTINSIGSNNGLAPIRRQAIIWTDDGLSYWRKCAPFGTKECIRLVITVLADTITVDNTRPCQIYLRHNCSNINYRCSVGLWFKLYQNLYRILTTPRVYVISNGYLGTYIGYLFKSTHSLINYIWKFAIYIYKSNDMVYFYYFILGVLSDSDVKATSEVWLALPQLFILSIKIFASILVR